MTLKRGEWVEIGKFWINTRTGQMMPIIRGGALPATDAFTGDNFTELPTHSASWTLNVEGFYLYSNALSPWYSDWNSAHWSADAFDNDQYATATFTTVSDWGDKNGVAVRCHASAETLYGFVGSPSIGGTGVTQLMKFVTGTVTQLGSNGSPIATNDVIRLEVSGTTITPKINGSTTGTPGAQTDSSIASGSAGVCGWYNSNWTLIDNWEGGNLGGGDYTVSKSEGVTLGESRAVTLSNAETSKSDGVTLGEAITARLQIDIAASEGVTLGETVSVTLDDLAISKSEGVTVGEIERDVEIAGALTANVTDGVTLGESNAQALSDLAVSQSEGITLGEIASASLADDLAISQADGVTLGEAADVQLEVLGELYVNVSDGVTVGDGGAIAMGDLGILIDPAVIALWRAGVEVVS